MRLRTLTLFPLLGAVAACGGTTTPTPPVYAPAPAEQAEAAPEEAPPAGRLPSDVRPLHYELGLQIVPGTGRFSGELRLRAQLDKPRKTLWLHGQDLNVTSATLEREGAEPVALTYEQVTEDGVAALRAAAPIEPGEVTLHFVFDADLGKSLRGLYRVDSGGESYAFTQLEATGARAVFPSFDEPAFKTPYDLKLRVKKDHVAISTSTEISSAEVEDGMREVKYATTEKLPTYLIAFAVGPLEIVTAPDMPATDVRKRPLPFRGIAAKGRGAELAYALKNTQPMLEALERYFDQPYPYDKLDIIAVPDFGAGAMENVGAITFREQLLLLKEDAPERQVRGFTYVMAHELAHMWFGNLVTMPWWNDLWLNEAFATWMGGRVVQEFRPEFEADLGQLGASQWAMKVDSQVSARQIRQPIESNHDIANAFDSITYSKGGAVLSMFERYLGKDTFRDGLRAYMRSHAHGNAKAEDLVAALSKASGKELTPAFFSFLEQPGVPLVEAQLKCDGDAPQLMLKQSRYLPLGSGGERAVKWQLPVCARYDADGEPKESCTLLTEAEGALALEAKACPGWVMPNAGAAGYYRWALGDKDLTALRERGWAQLNKAERASMVSNLEAAMKAGSIPAASVIASLAAIIPDADRHTLAAALGGMHAVRHALLSEADQAAYRAQLGKLLAPAYKKLGIAPRAGAKEDGNQALRRVLVLKNLAFEARDKKLLTRLAKLGRGLLGMERKRPAVATDVVPLALSAAITQGGADVFDAAQAKLFASEDSLERSHLLKAMASTHDDALSERVRNLSMDKRLKVNEILIPLYEQVRMNETLPATWKWVEANFAQLTERLSTRRAGQVPGMANGFCTEEAASALDAFMKDKVNDLTGGPRKLNNSLESIRLCAAFAKKQTASAHEYYAK